MSHPLAVETHSLTKRFGSFCAVSDISLAIPKNSIFGLLGPNGAGKSTTMRMLTGLLTPSSGQITISGIDMLAEPDRAKASIGYMSQKFSLYEELTVTENINFYTDIYQVAEPLQAREWALDAAQLHEAQHLITGSLSGGAKQRLAACCALLHRPSLLFLDEPTSGMAPSSKIGFWEIIEAQVERGTTVVVTTHAMDEAAYCDTIAFIHQGTLMAVDTPKNLQMRYQKPGLPPPTLDEVFTSLASERV